MDNFKDAPPSINEIRADRSEDGRDWTPRDALIYMLREIDNGREVDALVIIHREKTVEGKYDSFYTQATPDRYTCVGMIEIAKNMMMTRR